MRWCAQAQIYGASFWGIAMVSLGTSRWPPGLYSRFYGRATATGFYFRRMPVLNCSCAGKAAGVTLKSEAALRFVSAAAHAGYKNHC